MTEAAPTDKPAPRAKPEPKLAPEHYGWLVASLGVGSALLGSPVLSVACFTAMAVWVAATIKLGLEMSIMGGVAEFVSFVAVIACYGGEQLWILLRGRFNRDRAITLPLKTIIIFEHVLFLGVLTWLLLRVLEWARQVQAGAY